MSKPRSRTPWEAKDEILSWIDRGTWKHSWHLPKTATGYIDWFSQETKRRCRERIEDDIAAMIEQLHTAHALLHSVEWEAGE